MKVGYWFFLTGVLFSCAYKNTKEQTQKFADQLVQDDFTLSGTYHWNFRLMGGTQHSVHTLYPDSIAYSMEGKVYSTTYTMRKLSYEKTANKWIGEDGDGIVYVLFFQDITGSTVSIYKRKCKTNGLEEALEFDLPASGATEDHGWNVYTLDSMDQEDLLALAGTYFNAHDRLFIADSTVLYQGKWFSKLSHHAGERRWVGKAGSMYLQLFFKDFSNLDSLAISADQFTNLEAAYQTKFHTVEFDPYLKINEDE